MSITFDPVGKTMADEAPDFRFEPREEDEEFEYLYEEPSSKALDHEQCGMGMPQGRPAEFNLGAMAEDDRDILCGFDLSNDDAGEDDWESFFDRRQVEEPAEPVDVAVSDVSAGYASSTTSEVSTTTTSTSLSEVSSPEPFDLNVSESPGAEESSVTSNTSDSATTIEETPSPTPVDVNVSKSPSSEDTAIPSDPSEGSSSPSPTTTTDSELFSPTPAPDEPEPSPAATNPVSGLEESELANPVGLRRRQDAGGAANGSRSQASPAASASSVATTTAASVAERASSSSSQSSTATETDSGLASTVTPISIPNTAPAGALVFTLPPASVATSFYKISSNAPVSSFITFGWNFTNLIVNPTSLTVRAGCENGYTYPVGGAMDTNQTATEGDPAYTGNGIIPATQSQVIWDVYGFNNANPATPVPQGMCTLTINDERGFGAAQKAGYLAPNTQVTFALYTGEAYTPLASGWVCSGCLPSSANRAQPPFSFSLRPVIMGLYAMFNLYEARSALPGLTDVSLDVEPAVLCVVAFASILVAAFVYFFGRAYRRRGVRSRSGPSIGDTGSDATGKYVVTALGNTWSSGQGGFTRYRSP